MQKPSSTMDPAKDPRFIKYFKMLNMGIPRGAVENKMKQDNVDPCILGCFFRTATEAARITRERKPTENRPARPEKTVCDAFWDRSIVDRRTFHSRGRDDLDRQCQVEAVSIWIGNADARRQEPARLPKPDARRYPH